MTWTCGLGPWIVAQLTVNVNCAGVPVQRTHTRRDMSSKMQFLGSRAALKTNFSPKCQPGDSTGPATQIQKTYEHPHGQEGVWKTGRSQHFWFSEMFSSKTYEHPHGQEGVSETGFNQSYSDEKHLPK